MGRPETSVVSTGASEYGVDSEQINHCSGVLLKKGSTN